MADTLIDRAITHEQQSASSMPAVLFVSEESAVKIAALTLLDRAIVAAHRAGAAPIIVVSRSPLPILKRTHALGIVFRQAPDIPMLEGRALLISGNVLVQTSDLRRCLETKSRLLSTGDEALPVGVAAGISLAELGNAPGIRSTGVARVISDRGSARAAEKALWASLTSSQDGLVDRFFNRPCGRPISKLLIHTPATPNAISITSILIGVASALCFGYGTYTSMLVGAVLLQLSAIIDCVDGDVARIVFKETPLGKWIDLAGDQIVHIGVFAGIAIGVSKLESHPASLWLGASAVLGALLSFAVVVRGMRSPAGPQSRLKRLIDAATNRDFSVLLLMLALAGQMKIFLWLAGIITHLFWLTALWLQRARHTNQRAVA